MGLTGEIWCAPGNGGISYDAKCKNIKSTDVDTMVGFAVEEKFDYVVVAQDDPLALGMVDALAAVGIPAFGPDKAAARIEASKVFSKDLMKKYGSHRKVETLTTPPRSWSTSRPRASTRWSSRPTVWHWARACSSARTSSRPRTA